mgnify:FL=1
MGKVAQIVILIILALSLVANGVYFYRSTTAAIVLAELRGQQAINQQIQEAVEKGQITINQNPIPTNQDKVEYSDEKNTYSVTPIE